MAQHSGSYRPTFGKKPLRSPEQIGDSAISLMNSASRAKLVATWSSGLASMPVSAATA